jgi:hypothetical protein
MFWRLKRNSIWIIRDIQTFISNVQHNNYNNIWIWSKNSTNWHSNMFWVHNLAIKNLSGFKKVMTYIAHKWTHLSQSFLNYVSEHSINEWCTLSLSQIKNDLNNVCRACRVMKLWYSSLLQLKSFWVSKSCPKLSLLKTIQILNS